MKKNSKDRIWTMGKDGQLVFDTMDTVVKERYRPDSIWEHPAVSLMIMLLCGIMDYMMFRQLFGSFLYDSVWMQRIAISGMLVCFDVGPVFLGRQLKLKHQGMKVNKTVIAVFAAAFAAAFGANLVLRIAMKDLVLPDLQAMMSSVFGDVSMGTPVSKWALPYAWFSALLPLATSLVSFGISFAASNPLRHKMKKLKEEQNVLQRKIDGIRSILAEYGEDDGFRERILADDDRNYLIARRMAREKALSYLDYIRERIVEHVGTASAANALVSMDRGKLEELFDTELPGWEDSRDSGGVVRYPVHQEPWYGSHPGAAAV